MKKRELQIREKIIDILGEHIRINHKMHFQFHGFTKFKLYEFKVSEIYGSYRDLLKSLNGISNDYVRGIVKSALSEEHKALYTRIYLLGGISASMFRAVACLQYYKGGILYENNWDMVFTQDFQDVYFDENSTILIDKLTIDKNV